MEQGGTVDGALQVDSTTTVLAVVQVLINLANSCIYFQERVDRIQSDLEELVKALNERCKQYGLRAKPTTLVELPFGTAFLAFCLLVIFICLDLYFCKANINTSTFNLLRFSYSLSKHRDFLANISFIFILHISSCILHVCAYTLAFPHYFVDLSFCYLEIMKTLFYFKL